MLSEEQLRQLGLQAVGDILMFQRFCSTPNNDDQANPDKGQESSLPERRKKLLALLSATDVSSDQLTSRKQSGRPPANSRVCSVGLRLSKINSPTNGAGAMTYKQIRSPLGDKSMLSLRLDMTASYDSILGSIIAVMFPGGKNPVLGPLADFTTALVNTSNVCILNNITSGEFTLRKYIEEKAIGGGALRIHLLCSPNMCDTSDQDDETDSKTLPELSHILGLSSSVSSDSFTFLDATESGEVAFRVSSTPQQSPPPFTLPQAGSMATRLNMAEEFTRQHIGREGTEPQTSPMGNCTQVSDQTCRSETTFPQEDVRILNAPLEDVRTSNTPSAQVVSETHPQCSLLPDLSSAPSPESQGASVMCDIAQYTR